MVFIKKSLKTVKRRRPQTSKKRKLMLNEITKCNPRTGVKDNNQCLPNSFYNKLSKTFKNEGKDEIFDDLGCKKGEEHCLLDKAPISENEKKELRKQYLRPRYPKQWLNDPDMWLDNYNILHVMKQYEEGYPWFKFLGVFPIDFSAPNPYKTDTMECLYKELCTIDLKKEYNSGTRGIGIIFNLDPHYKGGSHWVGLYINLNNIKKPSCSYFDSYGYKTPQLIARLMRSLRLQIPSIELGFNARRFQFGGSECGMFSMYFIICMINGITFRDFCKDSVNDEFMLNLRQILFSK